MKINNTPVNSEEFKNVLADIVISSRENAPLCVYYGAARKSNDAGMRHNHRAQALVFRGLGAEPTNKLFAIRPGLHCLPLSTRTKQWPGSP